MGLVLNKLDPKICETCDKYYRIFSKLEDSIDLEKLQLNGVTLKKWNALIFNLDICIKKGWSIKDYEQRHRHDEEDENA